jgi:chromosome segregation ATPase
MPDFQVQLENIARLRAAKRQQEEAVYGARVGLRSAEQQLIRAKRRETSAPATPDAEVTRLRAQMTQINTGLAAQHAEQRALVDELDRIRSQLQLLDDLKARLRAVGDRLQVLQRKLVELQQLEPASREKVDALRAQIDGLRRAQAELEQAIRAASERLDRSPDRERELRGQLESVRARIESLRADLAGLQDRVTELQQPVFDDSEAIDTNVAELKAGAERNLENRCALGRRPFERDRRHLPRRRASAAHAGVPRRRDAILALPRAHRDHL